MPVKSWESHQRTREYDWWVAKIMSEKLSWRRGEAEFGASNEENWRLLKQRTLWVLGKKYRIGWKVADERWKVCTPRVKRAKLRDQSNSWGEAGRESGWREREQLHQGIEELEEQTEKDAAQSSSSDCLSVGKKMWLWNREKHLKRLF